MSIIRVRKDERYFTASNEPFVDKRLSWETRGLIAYLLTKPNNWQVRIEDLERQGPAKLHKLRRMLAESRMYGYMNRIRYTKPDGTFDWITEVFESPSQNPNPSTSVRFSTSGLSTTGKPADIVITDPESTELKTGVPPTIHKTDEMPLEWKLGHGEKVTEEDLRIQEDSERKDSANLIATGFGVNATAAYNLAYAFQVARDITIPTSKVKGQRKAVKEMLEMKVTPKNITDAVKKLNEDNMTFVDLFGVSKTAIGLANPAPNVSTERNPMGI